MDPEETTVKRSWLPTNKWWVDRVTAIGAWFVALIQNGWVVSPALQIIAVGIVVAGFAAWKIPNAKTLGGVPYRPIKAKRRRAKRRRAESGQGLVEALWIILLVLLIVAVLVWLF